MTIVLLIIFLWQCGIVLFADENIEAEKFGKLWDEWLQETGLDID